MKFNKYWFKPKGFGYGATPTTWEGWLVVILFIIYLLAISKFLPSGDIDSYIFYLVLGMVILIMISKNRTDGEWRWNWGKKSQDQKSKSL